MNTNIDKKQKQKIYLGIDMLADRQQQYIKSIGEIALVLHSNAIEQDTLIQPTNPETANSLLHNLLYFLSALDKKACNYLQNILDTESEVTISKYETLLEKYNSLQTELLNLKALQNN